MWWALVGCARMVKLVAPPAVLVAPGQGAQEVVSVEVDAGYPREAPHAWSPDVVTPRDGRSWERPESITPNATLTFTPAEEGVRWSVWVQGGGFLDRRAFRRVVAVAGSLPGRLESELRWLPAELEGPTALVLEDLTNPWNAVPFDHGDLLMVVAEGAEGRREHYLFENRRVGLHTGFSAGVLVRIPTTADVSVTPILTTGATLGWRAPSRAPGWRVLDRIVVVASVGIGSTEVPGDAAALAGVFDAALVGGGLSLVDVVSVQALGNASALVRDASETGWTLAVGIDAVGVAAVLGGAVDKAFRARPLSPPAAP